MKRRIILSAAVMSLMQSAVISCSSSGLVDEGHGELRISFASVLDEEVRSANDVPDTSDFILTVMDADGHSIYDGRYADCPETMNVEAGSYTVSARSVEFSKPAFSKPQYGDEQCVVVKRNETINVHLICRQLNSGIRLNISPAFLDEYPSGVLFLKSSEGRIMYSYSEKRYAYFKPGPVSLVLNQDAADKILMTRDLEPQEMVVIGVGAVSGSGVAGKGVTIEIDTSRVWTEDSCVIGEVVKGNTPDDALSVAQAISLAPLTDVWVSGYVVGGDLTSSSGSFEEPFKARSNIILGPRAATTDRNSCVAVQLQAGSIRDELNLVDNPSMLGRKVCLKGDVVVGYFNMTGLKNVTDVVY